MAAGRDAKEGDGDTKDLLCVLIFALIYLSLSAIYIVNSPSSTVLGFSPPLLLSFALWILTIVVMVIFVYRVWR